MVKCEIGVRRGRTVGVVLYDLIVRPKGVVGWLSKGIMVVLKRACFRIVLGLLDAGSMARGNALFVATLSISSTATACIG